MYGPVNIPIVPRVVIINPRNINIAPVQYLFFITQKEAIGDWKGKLMWGILREVKCLQGKIMLI